VRVRGTGLARLAAAWAASEQVGQGESATLVGRGEVVRAQERGKEGKQARG
jgi:hypothetical protein